MLEGESTNHRGRTTTGSGQNGEEAVAGAASETYAKWLHLHPRCAPSKRYRREHKSLDALYLAGTK